MFRLLLAGGGTGGHLFPAVAVAEEFMRRDPETQVLFVGTGRPVEEAVLKPRGLASRSITSGGLLGKSLPERLVSLAKVPIGVIQAATIIREFKPDLTFCVGGYAAGPVGLAARLMRRFLVVQEQNSVPGLTNRLLGRLADLVFISFASSRSFFPEGKVHLTGNPIRGDIAARAEGAEPRSGDGFHLLVVGGSQGAHAINEAMLAAMVRLAAEVDGLAVRHQTGAADLGRARSVYQELGVEAEVSDFIQDMAEAYLWADLVVARAGALTLAELTALARPAVFVPLPSAAHNHQEINARSLVELGGAETILQADLTPDLLADKILALSHDPERRRRMGQAARQAAKPHAATEIHDLCVNFLEQSGRLKTV